MGGYARGLCHRQIGIRGRRWNLENAFEKQEGVEEVEVRGRFSSICIPKLLGASI